MRRQDQNSFKRGRGSLEQVSSAAVKTGFHRSELEMGCVGDQPIPDVRSGMWAPAGPQLVGLLLGGGGNLRR